MGVKVKAGFARVGLSLPSTNFSPSADKTWLKEVDVVDDKQTHTLHPFVSVLPEEPREAS